MDGEPAKHERQFGHVYLGSIQWKSTLQDAETMNRNPMDPKTNYQVHNRAFVNFRMKLA